MLLQRHQRALHRTIVLSGALMLLIGAAPVSGQTTRRATIGTSSDLNSALQATARLARATVVELLVTAYLPGEPVVSRPSDLVVTQRGSGSGVVVDRTGYILTNAHVVRGAQRVQVAIPVPATGESILAAHDRLVPGSIVGIDDETDLAVVKVDAGDLPALSFGDSDTLNVGELVFAIGSPLGMNNSVSLGIVSAPARQLEPESPMVYVQTDAAIDSGSSGGPLVDLSGRIVGINTMIMTSPPSGHESIGFAVPSNIARTVYEQIRSTGRVRRGDIGMRVQTVTPVLAAGLGLPRDHGVIVADIAPYGPAAGAGLRPGDFILSLDGKAMENGRQLQVNLYRRCAGDVISLAILRDGQELTLRVAMIERDDPLMGTSADLDPRQHLVPRLGILGVTVGRGLAAMLGLARVSSGVIVASVAPGAIDAREGGFAPGDVIHAINIVPVDDLDGLRGVVERLHSGDAAVLQVERRGELVYVAFTVE